MVRLVGCGVEDDHDRVAGESLDHAAVLVQDNGHGLRPVGIQHCEHLGRGMAFGELREPLEVGEEDGHLTLLAAQRRHLRLVAEPGRELGREEGRESRLDRPDLLGRPADDGRLVRAEPEPPPELLLVELLRGRRFDGGRIPPVDPP